MKSEIPLPIPHLLTTSSIRKTRYEPAPSWRMSRSCARIARREEKKSTIRARSSPYSHTFVRAKYRRRMTMTQMIFVRNRTWPSGRRTAGIRSVRGLSLYSRDCFSSAILPVRRRHRAARGLHLRPRGLRGRGHRDPQGLRRLAAAEELGEPRFPEVHLVRVAGLGGGALRDEGVEPRLDILHVDTEGFPDSVVVAGEPVRPEVVRLVDDHPLEFVLVEPRVPGPAAVPVAPTVRLPPPGCAAPAG